jgi:HK97 family phage major capsid protein
MDLRTEDIRQLKQNHADLYQANRKLLDRVKGEGRDLTAQEAANFDGNMRQIETVKGKIKRFEELEAVELELAGKQVIPGFPAKGNGHNNLSDGGFSDVGEFFSALYRTTHGLYDPRLGGLQAATSMGTNVPSEGGYAIPPQFVNAAIAENLEDTVLLKNCDRVEMTSDLAVIPGYKDLDHSASSPFGITWQAIPDNGQFPTSNAPPLKVINLNAKKFGAYFAISNIWLDDSMPGMSSRVQDIFGKSLRWFVESELWTGNGAGRALGAINAAGTLSIAKETGQPNATICIENILQMWSRLRIGSHSKAVWAANPTCFPQLGTLSVGVGTAGVLTSLLQTDRGIAGEPSTAILGRPLFLSEHLPSLGSPGDIMLLDPTLYVFGDRQQAVIDVSPHALFNYDQCAFRAKIRFDAQPALPSVCTPQNGVTTAWAVKISQR